MKSEIFSSLLYITRCFMLSNVTTLSEIDIKTSLWLYSRVSNRLLIIPFFTTLPNLIQHSPFINFGEFCQPPLLFQTPRLSIHVHSRQRQREAQAKLQNCLLQMLFLPHRTKLFSDYNKAQRSVKSRIEQKSK